MFFETDKQTDEITAYFGTAAEQMNAKYPTDGRMMRAIKSILGTDLTSQTPCPTVKGQVVPQSERSAFCLYDFTLSLSGDKLQCILL